jgi:TRAP transporter TAXI family solute receptor
MLAACERGPDAEQLRRQVEERLRLALPSGKLRLAALDRRGSQADTKAPPGETRRIVYFDAVLVLETDFDFGAWDGPGVAGLVSALGAGPRGLAGIRSGGNRAGDQLRVHGTAGFRRDNDAWVAVPAGGYSPAVAPEYARNAPRGIAAILEAMRKVVDSLPKDASPAQREAIEEELVAAHAAIRARMARITDGYGIAAGPEHGQYLRFAQALSADGGMRTVALITRGGDENLRLMRSGKVALALAQGDAAADAYEGRGTFSQEGAYTSLRAVGSLYPEPVHVMVRSDSTLRSVADLKGRRIAIGEIGSASRTTALRVLQAHGLTEKDIVPIEQPLREALVRLGRQEIDAVIQIIGVPADSIRDAIAAASLRLLPLSAQAIAGLADAKRGYFAYTMVRGTYASQVEDVPTIATSALLLAGPDLSEAEVARIARYVFERGRDLVARGSAQGALVSAANARSNLPIPLHAGAEKALATAPVE